MATFEQSDLNLYVKMIVAVDAAQHVRLMNLACELKKVSIMSLAVLGKL